MPLTLKSTGGGSVTLDTPSTASAFTLTVPAITGTAVVTGSTATVSQAMLASGVAGNGPAFRAYLPTNQTISNNTDTKVTLSAEIFDTANCFDSTTNYRFTPNVAGYYMFTAGLTTAAVNNSGTLELLARIRKNGTDDQCWSSNFVPSTAHFNAVVANALTYMNGSTDYVELWMYQNTGATLAIVSSNANTFFAGFLARAA